MPSCTSLNAGMCMHLASTRVVCSSCHPSQFNRRPVSIRCSALPNTPQQRLHRKRSHACTVSCSAATQEQPSMGAEQSRTPDNASSVQQTDFVVIGSGIGGMLKGQTALSAMISLTSSSRSYMCVCAGLCCAAMLARYGYEVTVCESHYALGGAAHTFEVKGHHFDSGPSFFAGLSGELCLLILYFMYLAGNRSALESRIHAYDLKPGWKPGSTECSSNHSGLFACHRAVV